MLSFDTQGIHLFAFTFHWYAILTIVAAWAAVEVASRLATRIGLNGECAWRGLLWVAFYGLIGARAWFVLFPPTSYVDNGLTAGWLLTHFFDLNQGAIAVWDGGLSLIGAIIGGTIGLWLFARKNRLSFPVWLDVAAVALPLAQAIVRIADAINQNLYGPPTTLPWGVLIDDSTQRVGPYRDFSLYPLNTTRFHPAALYEVLFSLILFFTLLIVFLRYRQHFQAGDIALLYAASYGIGRFLLELLRVNVSQIDGINVSQVVAGVTGIFAVILLVRRRNTPGRVLYQNRKPVLPDMPSGMSGPEGSAVNKGA